MRQNLYRWILLLASLLVLGPMAGALTASLRAADGGHHASLFVNDSLFSGILVTLGVFILAAIAGITASFFTGLRHGFLCAGLVLAWAAWCTGQLDRILHQTLSRGTMFTLSAEALLVGLLALLLAVAMILLAHRPPPDPELAPHHHAAEPRTLFDATTLPALGVSLVVAAIIAWLVAQDTLKGQTFAAAALAAMLGATAGRATSPTSSALPFVGAIVLLAIASPVAAAFMHPADLGPTRAALAGTIMPLARPLPLDWVAGAFVGIPMGLSWASSLVEKHGHAKPAA